MVLKYQAFMPRQSTIRLARTGLLGAVLCLAGSACAARTSEIPAYPLYPNPERHLDASKVARLVALTDAPMSGALLKSVDGKDLPDQSGQAFELLPGCHVVQTTNNLTMANDYVTWRGSFGSRVFPLRMKPGHTYVVRLSLVQDMSGGARMSIRAEEQDLGGTTTATFDSAKSVDEIKACLAWHGDDK
jgi:hypothetical protein